MRVLFIGDRGSVGGAAKALMELVLELKNLGITPIVCTGIRNDINHRLNQEGIENFAAGHFGAMNTKSPYMWKRPLKYPYEFLKYCLANSRALKVIEKQVDLSTVDIIHTNSARNDIGCLIHEKYGIPHVMHIREFGQEDFDCCIYKKDYYQYLNTQCSVMLAVSNAVRESWIDKGIRSDKCRVLYDGVDFSSFLVKSSSVFSQKALKLIIAGGVCAPKGQHIAIEAIRYLPSNIRNKVTLDIAGWFDGRYVRRLKKNIIAYGLENNVRFLGIREDLGSILKDYDIGLMCSKSEGFGRVTAEYLYTGLGVIAADTGASRELVLDQKTGLIYSREDAGDLAEKIQEYYRSRDLLIRHATAAHENAIRFSSNRNAREVLRIYESVRERKSS